MSDQEHHDDAELSRLYRGGRVEEPPPELDRRILAAARSAGRPRRRWPLAGLATAAVAVLAVAILLRPALGPSIGGSPQPAKEATESGEAAPASAPALPSPPPARRLGQVEEVVVTGTPLAVREDARSFAAGDAAADDSTAAVASSYAAPDCPDPYPLPPGAAIRALDDGIRVEADGTTFTLRCVAGQWRRSPAADRQP